MVARVKTVAFQGIDVLEVDVQVQIVPSSFVGIVIVGLPDKAVGESRERVRGALGAIGLALPPKRVVSAGSFACNRSIASKILCQVAAPL